MPSATSSLARLNRPKAIELNKRTFKKLFKPIELDYYETTPIIDWFNQGTGLDKRFRNYRQSPKTQSEVDRWNGVLSAMITAEKSAVTSGELTADFGAVVLVESGESQEGIQGKASVKIHRVLMPHFLEWLQKGTDYALVRL